MAFLPSVSDSLFNASRTGKGNETTLINKVEDFLNKGKSESAILHLETLLELIDHKAPIEYVKQAGIFLFKLLPSVKVSKIKDFSNLAIQRLNLFPCLTQEQLNLAEELGNWYASHFSLIPEYELYAIHFYSRAIQIAERYHVDQLNQLYGSVSNLLIGYLANSKYFDIALNKAVGDRKPQKFSEILQVLKTIEPYCIGENGFKILTSLYEQALEVYNHIDSASKPLFSHFLTLILAVPNTLPPPILLPVLSGKTLKEYRQNFMKEFLSIPPDNYELILKFQKKQDQDFRVFFQTTFVANTLMLLGPPPCKYDLRMLGSRGRCESGPESDIEWFLLIENRKIHTFYFKRFVRLIQLQMIAMGETDTKDIPAFSSVIPKEGLRFDLGSDFADLIDEPENFATKLNLKIADPNTLSYMLNKSSSLASNDPQSTLFQEFKTKIESVLEQPLEQTSPLERLARERYALNILREKRLRYFDKSPEKFEGYNYKLSLPPEKIGIINIKKRFMEPLFHLLNDLSLYFGIHKTNTIEIVEELVGKNILTRESGEIIKQSLADIYLIRLRLQFSYQKQCEVAVIAQFSNRKTFVDRSLRYLLEREFYALQRAFWLVISPLYQALQARFSMKRTQTPPPFEGPSCLEESSDAKNKEEPIDLLKVGVDLYYKNQPSFIFCFVHHLIKQRVSSDEHFMWYLKLSRRASNEDLREVYIETLKLHHKSKEVQETLVRLLPYPKQDGYRQETRYIENSLKVALDAMTELKPQNPTDFVKVTSPSLGVRYLKEKVLSQILTATREFQDIESKKSNHSVARARMDEHDLHFKQTPMNPGMELGIFSLFARLVGARTPPTELVRFDVFKQNVRLKSYPVLVSKTIVGKTLEQAIKDQENIDFCSLSKLALCMLCVRAGDGHPNNFIVSSAGEFFCVDNDLAFAIPVERHGLFKKVQFKCALFCLNPDFILDPEALREFLAPSPNHLLLHWIDDLIEREKLYLELFKPKEIEAINKKNPDNQFKPKIELKPGTLITLLAQINHLQTVIKQYLAQDDPFKFLDILQEMFILDDSGRKNRVGEYVSAQYKRAFSESTLERRLQKATKSKKSGSLNSLEAEKAIHGKAVSLDADKRMYGLEEARMELTLGKFHEVGKSVSVRKTPGGSTLELDLASTTGNDSGRSQEEMLRGASMILETKGEKPTTYEISNLSFSIKPIIGRIFHDNITQLVLSNCSRLKQKDILLIAENIQKLRKLYLNSCHQIESIETEFVNLEVLSINQCRRFHRLDGRAIKLRKIVLVDNPRLRTPTIDFEPKLAETEVVWRGNPHADESKFVDACLKRITGKRLYSRVEFSPTLSKFIVQVLDLCRGDMKRWKERNLLLGFHLFKKAMSHLEAIGEDTSYPFSKKIKTLEVTTPSIFRLFAQLRDEVGAVSSISSLESLEAEVGFVKSDSAHSLGYFLSQCTGLAHLNLHGGPGTTVKHQDVFLPPIPSLANLRELHAVWFDNTLVSTKKSTFFVSVISSLTQLTLLDLSFNKIEGKLAEEFGIIISYFTNMKSLSLRRNDLGNRGCELLASSLRKFHQLEVLDLKKCNIKNTGTLALGTALNHCTTLTTLHLSLYNIKKKSGDLLTSCFTKLPLLSTFTLQLKHSPSSLNLPLTSLTSLTSLELSENDIFYKQLKETLRTFTNLTSLDLTKNDWNNTILGSLGKEIACLSQLKDLDISLVYRDGLHPTVDPYSVKKFAESLSHLPLNPGWENDLIKQARDHQKRNEKWRSDMDSIHYF